jgi:hypothetical protein
MRSPFARLVTILQMAPIAKRLGMPGMRLLIVVGSPLANELREAIGGWCPTDPNTSLPIADAARHLAALVRREFPEQGETAPYDWRPHAAADALALTLDDLDRAMRTAAAADPEDIGALRTAAVAMVSAGSSLSRIATNLIHRSGFVPAQARALQPPDDDGPALVEGAQAPRENH